MRLTKKKTAMIVAIAVFALSMLGIVGCSSISTVAQATTTGEAAQPADYYTRTWDPNGDCLECHVNMNHASEDDLGAQHLALDDGNQVKCIDCHADSPDLKTVHENEDSSNVSYTVDDSVCLNCHTLQEATEKSANVTGYVDSTGKTVNPHTAHSADSSLNPQCITCHSGHQGAADLQGCYDNCHHAQDLESCSTCHRDASVYKSVTDEKGW